MKKTNVSLLSRPEAERDKVMAFTGLHLTYVIGTVACYPAVVDQLLRLPVAEAKTKVSEDIKIFLKKVTPVIDGLPPSDLDPLTMAADAALFDLYGLPQAPADGDEYCWEAIEIEDRRREEFYALVVNALGGQRGASR